LAMRGNFSGGFLKKQGGACEWRVVSGEYEKKKRAGVLVPPVGVCWMFPGRQDAAAT